MANSDKARAGAKEPTAADDDLDPDIDVGEQDSAPDGDESPEPGSHGSSGSGEDAQGSVTLPDEGRQDAEESVEGPDERRSGEPGANDDSDAEPTASDPDEPAPDPAGSDSAPATSDPEPDEPDADAGTETDSAADDPVGPAPSGFNGRMGWTSAAWIPEPEDLSSGSADTATGTGPNPDPVPDVPAVADVPAASAPASPLPGGGPELFPVEPEGSGVTATETERPDPGRPKKAVRRAHLTLSRIEPWSVMKFSFIVSLVCFIILAVAVAVVYVILDSLGVFDAMTELITSLTESSDPEDSFEVDPTAWFSAARVFGFTALVGALNVILITALSTVGAMLYNLAADLVGGLDITLSESE